MAKGKASGVSKAKVFILSRIIYIVGARIGIVVVICRCGSIFITDLFPHILIKVKQTNGHTYGNMDGQTN